MADGEGVHVDERDGQGAGARAEALVFQGSANRQVPLVRDQDQVVHGHEDECPIDCLAMPDLADEEIDSGVPRDPHDGLHDMDGGHDADHRVHDRLVMKNSYM